MKKILFIFVICFAIIFSNFTDIEAAPIQTIKIGYVLESDYEYTYNYSSYYRLIVDYFGDIYDVCGKEFEFVAIDKSDLFTSLVEDEVDIVALSIKPEFVNEYTEVEDSYVESKYMLSYDSITNIDLGAFDAFTLDSNTNLIETLEAAAITLGTDDEDYYTDLIDIYFNQNYDDFDVLTADEWEILSTKEEYIVAYESDHFPFSYTNNMGEADGISVDLMDEIASYAGIDIRYVCDGEIDNEFVDINLSIFEGSSISYHNDESVVYVTFPLVAVGSERFYSSDGYSFGYLDYTFYLENTEVLPDDSILFENYETLEDALFNGEVDYILATSAMAQSVLEAVDGDYIITPLGVEFDVTMSYSKFLDERIVSVFNKLLSSLDSDLVYTIVINSIAENNTSFTLMDVAVTYRFEIAANLFISAVVIIYLYQRNRKKLLDQIYVDPLTGFMTEKKFFVEAKKILELGKPGYSIVSFDIDNFKYLNETVGYEGGSKLIKLTADHIRHAYGPDTLIARIYGDQFLVLTDKVYNGKTICGKDKCEGCITDSLREVLFNETILKTSVGIYDIKNTEESLSYMVDCAHIARRMGKGTYAHTRFVFDEQMEAELKIKNRIVAAMEGAIQNNEFFPMFQPKFDFKTGQIIGCEALVRWDYHGGMLPPDSFIPLFEQNGFINVVDFFILKEACRVIRSMENKVKIAVNISGVTLLQKGTTHKIITICDVYEIDHQYIEIEITESAFTSNYEEMIVKVNNLREAGFSVAMDDFGSGLSSLNRLKNLKFDVLKIDKQFLGDSLSTDQGYAIVKSVVMMAKDLELIIVCEGVETKEQANLLKGLGCDIAQGYYYSRPLLEQDFMDLVYEDVKFTSNK